MLHPLSEFISDAVEDKSAPAYWYSGTCPQTGDRLQLPRTRSIEAIARGLMQRLEKIGEGKMFGVLRVETRSGEQRALTAFSGLLDGESIVAGWVPPIPGRESIALQEAETLDRLTAIQQELIALQQLPARQEFALRSGQFAAQLAQLAVEHRQRQQQRQIDRQRLQDQLHEAVLAAALARLDDQSRRDGIDRRHLKRQHDRALQPLAQAVAQADAQMQALKQQRRSLSQQLQAQMHAAYSLSNFAGRSASIWELGRALPTGTGDCCAPKLLHYAATHQLKPIAMAEFWWGDPQGDKRPGEFYGACVERCQPILGFLLSGLPPAAVPILYEDDWLLAIDKPAGLLSVPGRTSDRQDSVLSRLRLRYGAELATVHRLDQDTSGLLLIARDRQTHRHFSRQFQARRVEKLYEAIVVGTVEPEQGTIDLPLASNPHSRPCQQVDRQRGKSCLTHFRVLERSPDWTRLEFNPVTGRTHQLRVHAAIGLNSPIVGDRLYGQPADRLHLHARELRVQHPGGQVLHLQTAVPF